MSHPIEWAVISTGFRGALTTHKEGLGSREEAEAWLTALKLTEERQNYQRFMMKDSVTMPAEMRVVWREKPVWRSGDPTPEPSEVARPRFAPCIPQALGHPEVKS